MSGPSHAREGELLEWSSTYTQPLDGGKSSGSEIGMSLLSLPEPETASLSTAMALDELSARELPPVIYLGWPQPASPVCSPVKLPCGKKVQWHVPKVVWEKPLPRGLGVGDLTPTHADHPGVEIGWDVEVYPYPLLPEENLYKGTVMSWMSHMDIQSRIISYCRVEESPQCLGAYVGEEVLEDDHLQPWLKNASLEVEMRHPDLVLGPEPIVIMIPLRFWMRARCRPGPNRVEGTLANTHSCAWRAQLPGDASPQWYTWACIWFWKTQLRFWTIQKLDHPRLVAIGSEGGVAVHPFLYRRLAEAGCSSLWRFEDQYLGGYVDPLAGWIRHAGWTGPPSLKPRLCD